MFITGEIKEIQLIQILDDFKFKLDLVYVM